MYYPEFNHWDTNAWREDGVDGDYLPDFDIIGEWKEPLDFDPDCLPSWAKWIAMDEDGEWRWHEYEPVIYSLDELDMWMSTKLCGGIPKEYAPKNFKGHWKESLFSVDEFRKLV